MNGIVGLTPSDPAGLTSIPSDSRGPGRLCLRCKDWPDGERVAVQAVSGTR